MKAASHHIAAPDASGHPKEFSLTNTLRMFIFLLAVATGLGGAPRAKLPAPQVVPAETQAWERLQTTLTETRALTAAATLKEFASNWRRYHKARHELRRYRTWHCRNAKRPDPVRCKSVEDDRGLFRNRQLATLGQAVARVDDPWHLDTLVSYVYLVDDWRMFRASYDDAPVHRWMKALEPRLIAARQKVRADAGGMKAWVKTKQQPACVYSRNAKVPSDGGGLVFDLETPVFTHCTFPVRPSSAKGGRPDSMDVYAQAPFRLPHPRVRRLAQRRPYYDSRSPARFETGPDSRGAMAPQRPESWDALRMMWNDDGLSIARLNHRTLRPRGLHHASKQVISRDVPSPYAWIAALGESHLESHT